jgi:signal transduction histidine kinase
VSVAAGLPAAPNVRGRTLRRIVDSLAGRMLLASAALACLVAAVFATLVVAVSGLRDATRREAQSKDLVAATLELEKLVVDLETGLNGFALTGNERFLQPWERARVELPGQLTVFERLAEGGERGRRARELASLIRSYVRDYSVPLVTIARESPAVARAGVARLEGKRRTDAIRGRFNGFLAVEDDLASSRTAAARNRARYAIAAAVAGLVASAALIGLFGFYLARSIARPVREAAAGAERLAGGDLGLRLAEAGPGEVGALTRSFNTMAGELAHRRAELEAQNEQLRESERLKSEVISIVSHEVRTPLASVLGFTSLLLERDFDEETRHRYLGIIDTQGRRLASLVDDFLDVQRIEDDRLALASEPVDLAGLLREQVRLFTGQSDKHRLELMLPSGRLRVAGDGNRLAQVFANLLSNAIKYSPDGGIVTVTAERRADGVRVSVRDDGLGIPEDQQDRIFTKFFRADAAASGIAGSGLGLAFARAIVEAHGGRIGFTSSAGGGSTFWVELPLTEDPATSERRG